MRRAPLILVPAVLAAGCVQSQAGINFAGAISSLKLQITGPMGTAKSPLAVGAYGPPATYATNAGASFGYATNLYGITISAVDGMGQPIPGYAGPVNLYAVPGSLYLASNQQLSWSNGVGTGTVQVYQAYGPTRIWAEDAASYATGISDIIWVANPNIPQIQIAPNTTNSPLNHQRVLIDPASSQLVVTGISQDGFYITDLNSPGPWSSINVYTYSTPEARANNQPNGLAVGDVITQVTGSVSEFLGFTELNDVYWKPTNHTAPLPPYTKITCAMLNAQPNGNPSLNITMEQWESALVELDGAVVEVCPSFPNCPSYAKYSEWTLTMENGACRVLGTTGFTVTKYTNTAGVLDPDPDQAAVMAALQGKGLSGSGRGIKGWAGSSSTSFDPTQNVEAANPDGTCPNNPPAPAPAIWVPTGSSPLCGKLFTHLKGNLVNVVFAQPQWIVQPHTASDTCCPACKPPLTSGC